MKITSFILCICTEDITRGIFTTEESKSFVLQPHVNQSFSLNIFRNNDSLFSVGEVRELQSRIFLVGLTRRVDG